MVPVAVREDRRVTGAEIAERFEAANQAAIDVVLGPAQQVWDRPTEAEGWPVGVTARHIALGHELVASWARTLRDRTPFSGGYDVHQRNAEVAAKGVVATPEEVADLLRTNGAVVAATLRELDADHLDGDIEFAGRTMPRSMLADASVRHVQAHLASIRKAIDAQV